MKATITHVQAAYHWLMTTADGDAISREPRSGTLGRCPTRVRDLLGTGFQGYEAEGLQTEFLVTDASAKPRPGVYRYHVSAREFPRDAFVVLDANLQIAGPELSFWQMSHVLPLGELVKYGNALCARHCFTVGEDGHLVKRPVPLTSKPRLEAFARAMGTKRGNPNAFRALAFVVDGSESPMESCVVILLCLPRRHGGFGLPLPEMGHVVDLDDAGKLIAGKESCRCDMYWDSTHYDLEYDSNQDHTGPKAAAEDAARRMAIRHMGIHVEELRWDQVKDEDKFGIAARIVAKGIGYRYPWLPEGQRFRQYMKCGELRRQLFHWERREAGEDPSPLRVAGLDW